VTMAENLGRRSSGASISGPFSHLVHGDLNLLERAWCAHDRADH
jgi:hypothetical protein